MSLLSIIQQAFPQARVTSSYRGPNNPLTIAHPGSLHAQGSYDDPHAVDIAPIPGVSFAEYVAALKKAGINPKQAYDEASHPFPWTTGPNWHIGIGSGGSVRKAIGEKTMAPYYTPSMGQSMYPVGMEAAGVDPLAPEPMRTPVPVDAGPSVSVPATAPVAQKKRGGILGALASVFMPDPGSLWAGALRDGVFNAKESQRNYQEDQLKKEIDLRMANQKLQTLLKRGEYAIAGNNVVHYPPDGGPPEIITPPDTPDPFEKKIKYVYSLPEGPEREFAKRVLLGANADEIIAQRADAAKLRAAATTSSAATRAAATVKAAGIRGSSSTSGLPPLPPGAKVIH